MGEHPRGRHSDGRAGLRQTATVQRVSSFALGK